MANNQDKVKRVNNENVGLLLVTVACEKLDPVFFLNNSLNIHRRINTETSGNPHQPLIAHPLILGKCNLTLK